MTKPEPKRGVEVRLRTRTFEQDGLKQKGLDAAHGVETTLERALVIKAIPRRDRQLEDPFAEIVSLCDTAGAEVVETMAQNLDRIHPATYLGKGKITEIAARAAELDVNVVVADNDLSPAQGRNLEKLFERKVVDRSQLIMDIFARRASSLQAQIQVELAQLKYARSRLKRMWTHLERYEGGIGMRGPGETQLESDRRIISRRIQKLQRQMDEIQGRQQHTLSRRPAELLFAIVGYTNAGKSTLLNRLTGANELVEDKLFATLETRTRKWTIDGNRHVLLKDTVGFIRELPHHLVASFHATLAESQQADILLHVVDASTPQLDRHLSTVDEVLRDIGCGDKTAWLVLNKWDSLPEDRKAEVRRLSLDRREGAEVFEVSAVTGEGLNVLRDAVLRYVERRHARLRIIVPHHRGDLLAFVSRHGNVLSQEVRDDGILLDVELGPVSRSRLAAMYPEGMKPTEEEAERP